MKLKYILGYKSKLNNIKQNDIGSIAEKKCNGKIKFKVISRT
jgi:hypothetical protein